MSEKTPLADALDRIGKLEGPINAGTAQTGIEKALRAKRETGERPMVFKKISDLPDFEGKELLLEAQRLGEELAGPVQVSAADAELIGLVNTLVRRKILSENDNFCLDLDMHGEEIKSLVDQEVGKICSAENLTKIINREAERVIDETIRTELRKLYQSGDGRQIIMDAVRRKLEL